MMFNPELWIAVSYVIALVILVKLGWSALVGALDAHGEKIRVQLDDVRKLREDAEALLAAQQLRQREAINEAKELMAHAHAEAERITGAAAADLEHSIALRRRHAVERIVISESQAVAEVRAAVIDIGIEAAGRVIARNLDYWRAMGIVDQSIADLPQLLN